jgi:hypothetical protein
MNDRTQAEALRIAYDRLEKLGWKYSYADIGKMAKAILDAMKLEAKP